MVVLTGTKGAESSARFPFSGVRTVSDDALLRWVRTAAQLAGLVLGGAGLLLGLAVIWTHLARGLPLATLVHHHRALRAMLLTGAGLGFLLFGRRAGGTR